MVLKDEYHDVILAAVKSPLLAPEPDSISVSTYHSRSRAGVASASDAGTSSDGADAHAALCSRVSMAFEEKLEAMAKEEMNEFLQVLGIGGGGEEGVSPLKKSFELLSKRSGVIGGSGRPEALNPILRDIRLKRHQELGDSVVGGEEAMEPRTPASLNFSPFPKTPAPMSPFRSSPVKSVDLGTPMENKSGVEVAGGKIPSGLDGARSKSRADDKKSSFSRTPTATPDQKDGKTSATWEKSSEASRPASKEKRRKSAEKKTPSTKRTTPVTPGLKSTTPKTKSTPLSQDMQTRFTTSPSSKTPSISKPNVSPRLQLKTAEGTRHDLSGDEDGNGAGTNAGASGTRSGLHAGSASPGEGRCSSELKRSGVDGSASAVSTGDAIVLPEASMESTGIGGDIVLGSLADIVAELRAEVPVDLTPIDKFLGKADELEERLEPYAEKFLASPDSPPRFSRISKKLFYIPPDYLPEEANGNRKLPEKPTSKTFADEVYEARGKTLEFCTFPGYREDELTDLPHTMEAPQVLNRVIRAMDFPPGFKKIWRKIFLSESSIAILCDMFWWVFMERFEPTRCEERDHLFARIANHFTVLVFSVPNHLKDKFFDAYPGALAQAVYAAFAGAFPDLNEVVDEDFMNELVATSYEWISGIHPPPDVWKNWKLNMLNPNFDMDNKDEENLDNYAVMVTAAARRQEMKLKLDVDVNALEKMIESSCGSVGVRSGGVNTEKHFKDIFRIQRRISMEHIVTDPSTPGTTVPLSRLAMAGTPQHSSDLSHPLGPAEDFERIQFNLLGRSPLISHFLYIRGFSDVDKKKEELRVQRTEIRKAMTPGQRKPETYKDVIRRSQRMMKEMQEEIQEVRAETKQIQIRNEKKRREEVRIYDKLKDDIGKKKIGHEVSIMSERIMEKWDKTAIPINKISDSRYPRGKGRLPSLGILTGALARGDDDDDDFGAGSSTARRDPWMPTTTSTNHRRLEMDVMAEDDLSRDVTAMTEALMAQVDEEMKLRSRRSFSEESFD